MYGILLAEERLILMLCRDISRLNLHIAKRDIARLMSYREINVYGPKQRYTEIRNINIETSRE